MGSWTMRDSHGTDELGLFLACPKLRSLETYLEHLRCTGAKKKSTALLRASAHQQLCSQPALLLVEHSDQCAAEDVWTLVEPTRSAFPFPLLMTQILHYPKKRIYGNSHSLG